MQTFSYHSSVDCQSCGAAVFSGQTECPYCGTRLTYFAPDKQSLDWLLQRLSVLQNDLYKQFRVENTLTSALAFAYFLIPVFASLLLYIVTWKWGLALAGFAVLLPGAFLLFRTGQESAEYREIELSEYLKKDILPKLFAEMEEKGLSKNDLIEAVRLHTIKSSVSAHSLLCSLIYE